MCTRTVAALVALAAATSACNTRADQPTPATVSVQLLARDGAGARFRVCNNGFQPIGRVEFTVGGTALTADTLLGQAHCVELTRAVGATLPDSAHPIVTRVEGR
jgi:hypothetical protein